jgi:hypothetical protein
LARGVQTLFDNPTSGSEFDRRIAMKTLTQRAGKISYALIAGLLGAPTVVIIIALLIGGVFKW